LFDVYEMNKTAHTIRYKIAKPPISREAPAFAQDWKLPLAPAAAAVSLIVHCGSEFARVLCAFRLSLVRRILGGTVQVEMRPASNTRRSLLYQ
jgi:hypothetical protein